jgi:hypothetical protein
MFNPGEITEISLFAFGSVNYESRGKGSQLVSTLKYLKCIKHHAAE